MGIDLVREELISLGAAARKLPAHNGKKGVHPSTIWRWIRWGLTGRDGIVVLLESVKVGGRTFHERGSPAKVLGSTVPADSGEHTELKPKAAERDRGR